MNEQVETRARRRIRKAVESRGFKVTDMEWEPWGQAAEMCGIPGGWTVKTDAPFWERTNYGNECCGLSVEEVLAEIDWTFDRYTDDCGCYPDGREGRHPAHSLKDEPYRPLHEPDCQWFIAYSLPWWNAQATR